MQSETAIPVAWTVIADGRLYGTFATEGLAQNFAKTCDVAGSLKVEPIYDAADRANCEIPFEARLAEFNATGTLRDAHGNITIEGVK